MISLHTYMFLNCYHPTVKFKAEYSRTKTNFLLGVVMKKGNRLVFDLYVNRQTHINIFMLARVTFLIEKMLLLIT